jgi:hypothetical protein
LRWSAVSKFLRFLLSNHSRCSLLKDARPEWLPDEVQADPMFQSNFSLKAELPKANEPQAHPSPAVKAVDKVFLLFRVLQIFQNFFYYYYYYLSANLQSTYSDGSLFYFQPDGLPGCPVGCPPYPLLSLLSCTSVLYSIVVVLPRSLLFSNVLTFVFPLPALSLPEPL